jgi:hypothetical protein
MGDVHGGYLSSSSWAEFNADRLINTQRRPGYLGRLFRRPAACHAIPKKS